MIFLFLIQAAVILAASQVLGSWSRKVGQPKVTGETVAGILLGPSLLGWLAPGAYHWLFPDSSIATLSLLGNLGLVLFMFLVGLRLDLKEFEEKRGVALLISLSSIAVPFISGYGLAVFLYSRLSSPSVSLTSFALFMGVAMSITAFPVLARILRETGLAETRLGTIAIACAAVDDVSAWLILAAILGFVRSGSQHLSFGVTLLTLVAYLALMVALRPLWARLTHLKNPCATGAVRLAPALLIMLMSSAATDFIGIHALFGAFFAGVVMPKEKRFVETIGRTVEPLTAVLIMPLFFALTGLRTHIGLAVGQNYWVYTLMIIAVAVAGKWLGAMISARFMGMDAREANALGILMNTRGMVELVILNIGFELGLLSPAVFSMMVMMALATTIMTAPLLRLVYPHRKFQMVDMAALDEAGEGALATSEQ